VADKRTRWIIEATSNIPDINTQLERLIKLQQTQNELTQQNTTSTALAIQRQREQIEQLSAAQSKANTTTSQGVKQQSDMMGALRKEYDLISRQLSGIVNLAAGAWAVGQLKTYVMEVINAKSAQDGFVASMEKMLGSRLKAEELNAKLMDIASKSPFSITQIQDVTKQLQGMGVETNKLIPYINALGDIAAIVGTGKLPLIAKAMTDVQNKGILMGGEIRQFTENGIPLFDLLAKSMEKPREEVVKLANAHKISFAEVEQAILQSTQKGGLYYGQMSAQAEQLGGKVANLGDKYTLAKAKVGDFFENGIKKGIEFLGDLIDATIGSASAIERLTKYFSAALTMWVSYRAAVLSTSAALKANQVATLEDLAAKEASTLATVTMSTATTGLKTSLSGLWTVMKANPWGALITVVTAAIGVYQLWGAASTEVISALGEEEIKLKNQKQLFSDSVLSVMALKEGTDKRRIAMENLISNYPEYFRGMSAEHTNNATLNAMLIKVNQSYEQRIGLARQAYVVGELEKKRTEFLQEEFELMERIKKRSPELYAQLGGDINKLMSEINKGGSAFLQDLDKKGGALRNMWDNAMNGTIVSSAAKISKGLKDIDTQIQAATKSREVITQKEHSAAIAAENQRWASVSAQMKKGTKEYEAAQAEHEEKVREMSGKTKDLIFKVEGEKAAKKKSTLELSLENDVKELKSVQQTYENKLKLATAEEALDIERANRMIKNKQALEDRIDSIHTQYALKRAKIMAEEIDKRIDYDMKDLKAAEDASKKAIAIKEKEAGVFEDLSNYITGLQQKQNDERIKDYHEASKKMLEIAQDFYKISVQYGAREAEDNKKIWETKENAVLRYWQKIRETELKELNEAYLRQVAHNEKMLQLYGGDSSEYTDGVSNLIAIRGKIKQVEMESADSSKRMGENSKAALAAVIQALYGIFEAVMELVIAGKEQIVDAYSGAIDAMDGLADANRAAMDDIISDTTLTYDELEVKLTESINRQKEILASSQSFAELRRRAQEELSQVQSDMESVSKGVGAVTSFLNGNIGDTFSNLVGMVIEWGTHTKRIFYESQAEHHKMLSDRWQDTIDLLNAEMAAEEALYQKKIELWDKELEEFRRVTNEKTAAFQESANSQKEIEKNLNEAKNTYLQENDNYRNQLLVAGHERRVADLERQRDMLLHEAALKGATEKEKADITLAFANLIQQEEEKFAFAKTQREIYDLEQSKNRMVQMATERGATAQQIAEIEQKYDQQIFELKTKLGKDSLTESEKNKLAQEELKAQESDNIKSIETLLNEDIKKLKDELKAKEQEVSDAKQQAQKDYAEYVRNANAQIFEAEKQMAIQQIRVEIALLKAKKNWFNGGKIREAIGDLENAINEISGYGNPYGYVTPDKQYTPDNPRGQQDPDGDGEGNGGGGGGGGGGGDRPDRPGDRPRPLFHGVPWLDLGSNPDGIDTIPIRAHKGERIVQTYLNQFLGPDTSNEQLVHGYLQYANFMDRLPSTQIPESIPMVLPDFSYASQNVISMDRLETEIREMRKVFEKKSLLNVNIDGNAVSISEQWEQHKVNYYDTIFKK
jgi:tape measure domain-containing protein